MQFSVSRIAVLMVVGAVIFSHSIAFSKTVKFQDLIDQTIADVDKAQNEREISKALLSVHTRKSKEFLKSIDKMAYKDVYSLWMKSFEKKVQYDDLLVLGVDKKEFSGFDQADAKKRFHMMYGDTAINAVLARLEHNIKEQGFESSKSLITQSLKDIRSPSTAKMNTKENGPKRNIAQTSDAKFMTVFLITAPLRIIFTPIAFLVCAVTDSPSFAAECVKESFWGFD